VLSRKLFVYIQLNGHNSILDDNIHYGCIAGLSCKHYGNDPQRFHHQRCRISRMLYCATSSRFHFPKTSANLALAWPETAVLLGTLTHRDAQSTNADLNAANDNHGVLDTTMGKPVVGIKSQNKAEHVLENK
jgi:hypothetical protein